MPSLDERHALIERRDHGNNVLVVDEQRGDLLDDRIRPLDVRRVRVPLREGDTMAGVIVADWTRAMNEVASTAFATLYIDAASAHGDSLTRSGCRARRAGQR